MHTIVRLQGWISFLCFARGYPTWDSEIAIIPLQPIENKCRDMPKWEGFEGAGEAGFCIFHGE
jgi:hypothetical protein